jgi:polyphosphate kinase
MTLPTLNRELSWLLFNDRVIEEAGKAEHPIYERCRFLSISASNLDEFFMIRVGSLFDRKAIQPDSVDDKTGMSVDAQLKAVFSATAAHLVRREMAFIALTKDLVKIRVRRIEVDQWSRVERDHFKVIFDQELRPLINLQVIDPKHPFPHLNNQQTYLAIRFLHKGKLREAILSYTADHVAAAFALPLNQPFKFALTEDIIWAFADELLPGEITEKGLIRVTRNADLNAEISEDDELDYKVAMKQLLKQRNRLQPVRAEFRFPISAEYKSSLLKRLKLHPRQSFDLDTPFNFRFFSEIEHYLVTKKIDAFFTRHIPAWPTTLQRNEPLIPQILKQDVLLSTPFHTMEPVIVLLREAAWDPKVSAIKITLYRVANEGRIVHELIQAAENGKDVLVVVELKARFDEANNISWASKLEEAGCRVIYGMDQYKVHSKVALIIRHDRGQLQTITHIATGNYNEQTAKVYTDAHLFSSHAQRGKEVQTFFNTLQTGILDDHWHTHFTQLAVSPHGIKSRMMELIDREIDHQHEHQNGRLIFKVNALTDLEIINALIRASQAGVQVDLIVRGICCLVPGVPGQTETITVTSLVGRFLEHARFYYGENNGHPQLYLSSADLMTRNMSKRIELAVLIDDPKIQSDIIQQLDLQLRDTINARTMTSDLRYVPKSGFPLNSHAEMIHLKQTSSTIQSRHPAPKSWWKTWFQR